MVAIKIECECGQHYAFEVEPVDGRVPSAVTCPSCGIDGTDAANAAIARQTSVQSPSPATPGSRLRVAGTAADPSAVGSSRTTPRAGTGGLPAPDRTQAKYEARAKIFWGDPPKEVTRYLMSQGFTYDEASGLVQDLFQERMGTIRATGIKYILGGGALMSVPIVALLIFFSVGYILVKTFGITVVIGLVGLWMTSKGVGMVLAPKSQEGDMFQQ